MSCGVWCQLVLQHLVALVKGLQMQPIPRPFQKRKIWLNFHAPWTGSRKKNRIYTLYSPLLSKEFSGIISPWLLLFFFFGIFFQVKGFQWYSTTRSFRNKHVLSDHSHFWNVRNLEDGRWMEASSQCASLFSHFFVLREWRDKWPPTLKSPEVLRSQQPVLKVV